MRTLALLSTTAACLVLTAGPAAAQATRTWVSGVGDDSFPCSRTAPCKTFAGAISKTATGGEISVLDPAGFGGVTITKSLSIVAENVEGGILAAGINGIIINGANIVVNLRGLIIEGAGSGLNGIRFINGAALHMRNCQIRSFNSASVGNQNGILINNTSGTPEIDITDTVISDNGLGAAGAGIALIPSATGGAKVTLTRVQLLNNVVGFKVDGDLSSGPIDVAVNDSEVSGSVGDGISSLSPNGGDSLVRMTIDASTSSSNGGIGVHSVGQRSTIRIGRSTVTTNAAAGLQANNSGILQSYGDNMTEGNGAANVGVTAAPPS